MDRHQSSSSSSSSSSSLLARFGSPRRRVEAALEALRQGRGVLVVDDENRENEGDMIFAAETLAERKHSW